MEDLNNSLKETFGFDDFRQGQEQTITQLLNGHSSLAIFPTGSGKSLCYQLAALRLPSLTLVVSPLLALIKDQLNFLSSKGIAAASIDSTLKGNESQQVMTDVRSGKTKILMVSVERFKNERFRQFIQSVQVSMLVIDEAHCISEWGHNFRPDYLKLPTYQQQLNIPLVLLLTATATKQVKNDMAEKFAIKAEHIVQTGFYRNNLDLSVEPVNAEDKNTKLLSLITKQLNNALCVEESDKKASGIIYVTLQRSAEQVAHFLQSHGVNACAYHAGFDSDKRAQIQTDFMVGKITVIVATIAFGMGIDKNDIRFVIHYDLPKSIENYSQEIGRAGRDGLPSNCITLANLDGLNTVENFVYGDTPELSSIEKVIGTIKSEVQHGRWELQLSTLSTASNIRQLPLKTLLVQLELYDVLDAKFSFFADFSIKLLQPKEKILASFNEQRQVFLDKIFSATAFKKVWGSLSFEDLLKDPSIERNRVISALEYLQEQQQIILATKKMTEVFNVDIDKLTETSLAKNLYHYFKDKEHKEIVRIADLVKFFELDRCLSVNLAHYFDDYKVPEKCGHCSVCRGEVAKLKYSNNTHWPTDETIIKHAQVLKEHLTKKIDQSPSLETYCHFFAGMTVPLFGRNKVKQLAGFASCEHLRYHDIQEKLQNLL